MSIDRALRPLNDSFTIPLTQGQVALVDERDWFTLRVDKWRAQWNPKTRSFYAVRSIRHPRGGMVKGRGFRRTLGWMHRTILGLQYGDRREVDHRNHNTLDNRRANLRVVSQRKNSENRRDQSPHGAGVQFQQGRRRPYHVKVQIRGVQHSLGYFDTPDEAQSVRAAFLRRIGEAT